jgi:hypothetical protein
MMIMKELCVSKLGLVAMTAGNLTLRMRFELWYLLEAPKRRDSPNIAYKKRLLGFRM